MIPGQDTYRSVAVVCPVSLEVEVEVDVPASWSSDPLGSVQGMGMAVA